MTPAVRAVVDGIGIREGRPADVPEEPFVEDELEVTSVGGVELAAGWPPQPVTTKASRVSETSTTTIERMGYS